MTLSRTHFRTMRSRCSDRKAEPHPHSSLFSLQPAPTSSAKACRLQWHIDGRIRTTPALTAPEKKAATLKKISCYFLYKNNTHPHRLGSKAQPLSNDIDITVGLRSSVRPIAFSGSSLTRLVDGLQNHFRSSRSDEAATRIRT